MSSIATTALPKATYIKKKNIKLTIILFLFHFHKETAQNRTKNQDTFTAKYANYLFQDSS